MRSIIEVNSPICTGCRACEMACALSRAMECNLERARVRVMRKEADGLVLGLPLLCRQCEDAPCVPACPEGALSQEPGTWILKVDEALCTGCGICEATCPLSAVAVDPVTDKAIACDLCGGQPNCVPFCHSGAIKVTSFDPSNSTHTRHFFDDMLKKEGLEVAPRLKAKERPQENLLGGKILFADLNQPKFTTEPSSALAQRFLGARGISNYLLYQRFKPGLDALDKDAPLLLGAGPLLGTLFPGAPRTEAMAKSPLTGFLGFTSFGGYWGVELKMAGYDNIFITGKAPKLSYLYIENDKVEMRDASHLKGKDCYELPELLRKEVKDNRAQVLCIGPAGENKVAFASLHTSLGNTGARTGMGAVMGSKNLKAIVVRGSQGLKAADPGTFFQQCKEMHEKVKKGELYEDLHTVGATRAQDLLWSFNPDKDPTWTWDGAHEASNEAFCQRFLNRKEGCFGCPVACMESYYFKGIGGGVLSCGTYMDFTFGPKNSDPEAFWENYLFAQRKGLDARACGQIINWLMELYEKEMITEKDTDGIPMVWGSREATRKIMEKIVAREGIGDVLAQGMKAAAKKFGKGTEDLALQAKGNPLIIGIPPFIMGYSFAHAINTTGDGTKGISGIELGKVFVSGMGLDKETEAQYFQFYEQEAEHLTGTKEAADPTKPDGKACLVYHAENESTASDIVGVCTWVTSFLHMPVCVEDVARLLTTGTGREITTESLLKASMRTRHLERAFNVREGLKRSDDTLPKKFLQPSATGKQHFTEAILEKMKDEYYQLRGWDVKTGIPTRATLEEFGLKEVAEELDRVLGNLP